MNLLAHPVISIAAKNWDVRLENEISFHFNDIISTEYP